MLDLLSTVLAAYFIGSVPFAVILARRWGPADLRRVGSGNVGAANVLREFGITPGVSVALLDMAKGAFSVWLAGRITVVPAGPAAAGLAAVVGHVFPVWLGFRGGKGVATAGGAFSVLTPLAAVVSFGVFLASIWISRYVSVGSVLAAVTLPPTAYLTGSPQPAVTAACAVALLIVFRHRTNLARISAGRERSLRVRERGQ